MLRALSAMHRSAVSRRLLLQALVGGLATVCAFGISVLPSMASAYDLEVHFQATMWIAELSGFARVEAFEIAKYDQATDDDPTTQPALGLPLSDFFGEQRRRQHHFIVSAGRFDQLRRDAFYCGPRLSPDVYRRIGYYLHAIEDSYSHRTYGPTWGQGLDGFAPDKPWHVPGNFHSMIFHKFQALRELRVACPRPGFPAPKIDFSRIEAELDRWVHSEQTAGVRGDPNSPKRWEALMSRLYGTEQPVYEGAVQEYMGWRDTQKREGWRK